MIYEKASGEKIETNCMMGLPGVCGEWTGIARDQNRGCKNGGTCATCGFDEHIYSRRIADIRENGLNGEKHGLRFYVVRMVKEQSPAT